MSKQRDNSWIYNKTAYVQNTHFIGAPAHFTQPPDAMVVYICILTPSPNTPSQTVRLKPYICILILNLESITYHTSSYLVSSHIPVSPPHHTMSYHVTSWDPHWPSVIPSHPKSPQVTPSHPKSPQVTLSHPKSPQVIPNHLKSTQITLIHP